MSPNRSIRWGIEHSSVVVKQLIDGRVAESIIHVLKTLEPYYYCIGWMGWRIRNGLPWAGWEREGLGYDSIQLRFVETYRIEDLLGLGSYCFSPGEAMKKRINSIRINNPPSVGNFFSRGMNIRFLGNQALIQIFVPSPICRAPSLQPLDHYHWSTFRGPLLSFTLS